MCLEDTGTSCSGIDYTFIIKDSYGDGLCCQYGNGSYEVKVDGEIKAEGGEFDSREATNFCGDNNDMISTTIRQKSALTCASYEVENACNASKSCSWSEGTCHKDMLKKKCIKKGLTYTDNSCN